jgi:LysR family glycine cleavage system transcriptional activator
MAINPPRPRMPPLNALKAFEASARHESFAKAADELGVTPAAVSHQVKGLEEWLGAQLFTRHAQGLRLTASARSVIPAFTAAFDALGRAVQDLRVTAPRAILNVAALPAVAQLWLTPRLPMLRAAFPDIQMSVHALEEPPDFQREPFDLGIFLMPAARLAAGATRLCDDVIFPVCTPRIAKNLRATHELCRVPLLRDTRWAGDWEDWLATAGVEGVRASEGPAFSLYSLAVQAALDGAGVLMAHEMLLHALLSSGSLVAPFAIRHATGLSLVILAADRPSEQARRLIDWLIRDGCDRGRATPNR